MADVFSRVLAFTLGREGGYVNDPSDAGGETNFGISKAAYPGEDIKGMTRERAMEIYRRDYWQGPGFDRLPGPLAAAMFDTAVNCGVERAGQLLQRVLNGFGAEPPLVVDGRLGPLTLSALGRLEGMDWPVMLRALVENLLFERLAHYEATCARRPSNRLFLLGWLRRVLDLRGLCREMGA